MSERKVLTKYYPPDFDPAALTRQRKPKQTGPRIQPVRLMAPFSMRCTSCGEYVYKGRKFNARKETPDGERYLGVQIFRFYIRCTRCSAEITFRTDPKNQDYTCERGAKRITEPWRAKKEEIDETDEERLDRLEREDAEADEQAERNAMEELEAKTLDAKREMAVADALDEIRMRNARVERADKGGLDAVMERPPDEQKLAEEREDEEAARKAFAFARAQEVLEEPMDDFDGGNAVAAVRAQPRMTFTGDSEASAGTTRTDMPPPPRPPPKVVPVSDGAQVAAPSFKRQVKKKKDHASLLGIKRS